MDRQATQKATTWIARPHIRQQHGIARPTMPCDRRRSSPLFTAPSPRFWRETSMPVGNVIASPCALGSNLYVCIDAAGRYACVRALTYGCRQVVCVRALTYGCRQVVCVRACCAVTHVCLGLDPYTRVCWYCEPGCERVRPCARMDAIGMHVCSNVRAGMRARAAGGVEITAPQPSVGQACL